MKSKCPPPQPFIDPRRKFVRTALEHREGSPGKQERKEKKNKENTIEEKQFNAKNTRYMEQERDLHFLFQRRQEKRKSTMSAKLNLS